MLRCVGLVYVVAPIYVKRSVHGICLIYVMYVQYTWCILGVCGIYLLGLCLRRRYTIRFARTEPADCPVHGSIVTCDMSLECPGHLKIG